MSNDPVPTPDPYVDQQNVEFEQQAEDLLNGATIQSLSPQEFRRFFREVQTPTVKNPNISTSSFTVKTSFGDVKTFLNKPADADTDLPVVYYCHGGGFYGGNEFDYRGLVFDLVERTGFAVILPQYTLAPEQHFPTQQEQLLEVLQWIIEHGHTKGLDVDKVAIVGDSAGGQLAPAISILNHQRNLGLPIAHQILLSPIINSASFTSTFSQFLFQDGPFINNAFAQLALTNYFGDGDTTKERSSITASPILMTRKQAKEFMPPTTIVTSQSDWLRDQGEDFAKLLQTSGVKCGVIQGVAVLHDPLLWNATRGSPTAELISIMVAGKLKDVLSSKHEDDTAINGNTMIEQNGQLHKRKRRF